MRRKYPDAKVEVYVDVIQKGRDFDNCKHGGLYKVPGTSPAEYRYFCWAGGAQDCGAYYAYTYQTSEIEARDVSARLKDVTKQGSNSSADYTVILTYDTGKTVTLDPSGYTVSADASTGVVNFKITDNDGKTITASFQGPAAIRYSDGGKSGVTGLPGTQYEWPESSVTLAADTPARDGYEFTQWQDQNGKMYGHGETISSFTTSLALTAQWKDVQAPEFTYEQVEVKLGATQAEVTDKVKPALTVTDNEPAEECTVEVTMEDGATNIAGERQVTVTVTDKAGNKTERKVPVTVTASALALTTPTFDSEAKTLTAQLASPGEDTITETGLVWGIITAPTTALNNGKFTTSAPVTTAGGVISTTPDITEGVTYYARAYAISGGVTYYSEQMSFGIGAASYGTFNITYTSGSTFTVTRTDGTDGEQTVAFRTVNGSAVGGTHFTHQAGTLTFRQGETSKTITVQENSVATAYNGKTATAYSNADRTYSVEIYRVIGGGTLGTTTRASRVMTKDGNHTVDRGCYEKKKVQISKTDNKVSNKKTSEPAYVDGFTMERAYTEYLTYLKATADSYEMHLYAWVYEWKDAYAWLRFTTDDKTMIMKFDIGEDYDYQNWTSGWFPIAVNNVENGIFMADLQGNTHPENSKMGLGLIYRLPLSSSSIKVEIATTGGSDNDWTLGGCEQESVYYDSKEPQLIAIAPMPDSTYKAGDQFVVSLIFDEIVDSRNTGSGNLNKITVHTSWGDATFTGGADTNVLYFTGTVKAGASGNLTVNSVDNINLVKDMCSANGTASSASSGMNTGSKVDGNQPNITVASNGVTGGVGTATVKVNETKTVTTSMRYVWSGSATMPATGWVNATAEELAAAKNGGLTLSTRQEPGSGNNGKWYLHVLASYEATGASAYQYTEVDFGTKESPKNPTPPPLSLTAAADDTSWATSRDITVTAANGETLEYHREGESGWKTISPATGGTVNVKENGTYTFRLRRGDDMETAEVRVERIDTKVPSASVGALSEEESTATPKAGVYTEIVLPVTFSDAESGVAKVEYAWTDSTGDPDLGSWQTLSDIASGSAALTYTAVESTETAKYLHIWVTDKVWHTKTAVSVGYMVISQSALDGNSPKIKLSEVPEKWVNDSVTLTWTVKNTSSRHFKVTLPDGSEIEDVESGTVRVTENKSVTVTVEDLDYGGISTATADVNCIDVTAPTVNVPTISADWTKGEPSITFTAEDSQSGVGKAYYKIVMDDHTTIPTGLTEFGGASYTVTLDEAATPTSGVYYVYYKFCDESPSNWETTGRETNFTEGFAGPFKIDRTAPTVTVGTIEDGWCSTAPSISLTSSDAHAGMNSLKYAVTKDTSTPSDLTPLDPTGGSVTVGSTDNGTFYIYYEAVDIAGNVTTGWSGAIRVDKQAPTLTVSGGTVGDATQTLSVASSFGVSGGTVTVKKPGGSTETVSGSSYTVTAAGTYEFTARSGSGLTASETVEIYAVSFDGNGAGSPVTQLVASGGKAVKPNAPTLDGHTFVEWEKGGAKYSFDSTVTANVELSAKWTLNAPTVTLNASTESATYNNGEAVITLTANPSHAAGDSVTYTYEWFKGSAKIEGAGDSTYTLDSVDDNGTYKVRVTAYCGHSLTSTQVTSNEVTVSVTAAQPDISAPTAATLTYGEELTDKLLTGGSASLNGVAVAGSFSWATRGQHPNATEGTAYSVVFTPEDSDNYLPVTFDVSVTVKKAPLTPSVAANKVPGGIYDGTKFSHESADGEIVLAGAVFGQTPTAHGRVEFVTKDVGENKTVNVTGITLDDDWGDNYVLSTNYLTDAPSNADVTPKVLTFDWHISEGGKEAVSWDGLYYTGGAYTVTATATNLVADDECTLTVGENGVQTNAGMYTAKVTGISNQNYKLPAEITRSYTINKAPLTPSVAADKVPGGVYNGTKYSHKSADGEIVLSGAVHGEAPTAHGQVEFVTKDVGENKPVNVTGIALDGSWGDNYVLSTNELTDAHTNADVTPKVLTFDWHISEGGEEAGDWDGLYYTGGAYTVTATATNLVADDECTLTVGENGEQTNAGTYTAKVTGISNQNYKLPAGITKIYIIKKAPLKPSVVAEQVPGGVYNGTLFSHWSADGEIVLTGAVHGEAPAAHGQVEFVTKDAGENKPVNVTGITLDGRWGDNYELTATALTNAPSNADVTSKVLTFVWHISEGGKEADNWDGLYYTKGAYTVTATATNLVAGDTCELTVGENNAQTNAGTYTAKITAISNKNYALPDDVTREYTIRKAPVTFTIDREVKPGHDWTAELNEDPNPGGYVIDADTDPDIWNDFALSMTYDSLEHHANVRQDGGLDIGGMFSVSFKRVEDAAGNAVSEDETEVFRNAGTYEIWVTLTDEPENFMFVRAEPNARTLRVGTVTVEPYEVRVIWQNLTFVYHGHKMHPTVRVENAFLADKQPNEEDKQGFLRNPSTFNEDLMAYAATESADAGDYPVTVTLYGSEAGNYTVSNPTAAVVIQPAPVVFEVANNEWLYHENEEQDRDVTLTASWGEVTNSPDTVVGDGYPGVGTRITLRDLGVTAEDIQYRLENGAAVDNPTGIGTYQVWVRIPNANFRHAGSADGGFHNVGVLRIAANEHPATYTVTFDPGRDERGNRFTGVKVPEPMAGLIPTQEITLPPAPENAPAGYVFAGWSRGGALYQPNEDFYMTYSDVTFEAVWTKEIFNIAGVVIDDTETPVPYVSVALMMGEHQIALTTTKEDGSFRFDGLIPNTYNLVFTWNGVVKTYMVEITDKNVEDGTYTLPGYRLNTVVEVAPGSGSVVVDLDPIITDDEASELYDADERTLVESGGTVEFMMKVENSGAAEGMTEKLKDVPVSTDNIGMVLDMSLTKTVTRLKPDGTVENSTVTPIDDSRVLIANLIYLPAELQGKGGYTIYRFHDEDGDGEDEVQTITTAANSDGERVEIVKNGAAIMVYARYYSTYVLTWYQNPWGSVTVTDTPHGTVTPNYPGAAPGIKVTLTAKPDEGYESEELTVTDIWGRDVPVTDNGDGTYSFTMPWGSVTVKATFRSKGCDGGEDCPSRRFTDLNVEAWYHEYTDYVISHELMRGMGGTTFAPDGIATRSQMVTALWILAGSKIVDYRMTYEDVENGMWYTEAVRWATSEGIVEGYSAARFAPNDPITREQMATMLYHYEQRLAAADLLRTGSSGCRLPTPIR